MARRSAKNNQDFPGQMTIIGYLDQAGIRDDAVEKVRRDSCFELYCFETTVNLQVPQDRNRQMFSDDDARVLSLLQSSGRSEAGLAPDLKVKYAHDRQVRFFVLRDTYSDFQIAEYCFGGRFTQVDAMNRLIQRLGVLPPRVYLTHMTGGFDLHLILSAFRHYGIRIYTEDGDVPELAKMLRKVMRKVSKDDLFFQVSAAEEQHNQGCASGYTAPAFLWQSRKAYLEALPDTAYELVEEKDVTPMFNYHVQINDHFYSIPKEVCEDYRAHHRKLHAVVTSKLVEITDRNGVIVCVHNNDEDEGFPYTTDETHMPAPGEVPYENRNGARFLQWASHVGKYTLAACRFFLGRGCCEMQGYLPCMGLITLQRQFSSEVLEFACRADILFARQTNCTPELGRIRSRCKNFRVPVMHQVRIS